MRHIPRQHMLLLSMILSPVLTPTSPQAVAAAEWYVDGRAPGPERTGRSWAQAWATPAAIDWDAVQPGDIIYLSGGTYADRIVTTRSGRPDAPITIKVSQEPGHNVHPTEPAGPAVVVPGVSLGGDWVTVDGAKDDDFAARVKATVDVARIKDNLNLKSTAGLNVWGTATGIKFRWMEVTTPDEREAWGVRFNPNDGDVDHNELAYLWIHETGGDGVHLSQNANSKFDALVVRHCLIERTRDDGLEVAAGTTLHTSIVRDVWDDTPLPEDPSRRYRGHPDAVQSTGNHIRVYNNVFRDWVSATLRIQGVGAEFSAIQIYGNLLYAEDRHNVTTAVELAWYAWKNEVPMSTWHGFVFANNTIVDTGNGALVFAKRDKMVREVNVRDVRLQNNVFFNMRQWSFGLKGGGANGWHATADDYGFEDNIVARAGEQAPDGTAHAIGIDFAGASYPHAEAFNDATKYDRNSSTAPRFADAARHDYRLLAPRGGSDLSALDLPGLDVDLAGNRRGADGVWDVGAFEFVDGDTPPRP